jgi:hypothetical protein
MGIVGLVPCTVHLSNTRTSVATPSVSLKTFSQNTAEFRYGPPVTGTLGSYHFYESGWRMMEPE